MNTFIKDWTVLISQLIMEQWPNNINYFQVPTVSSSFNLFFIYDRYYTAGKESKSSPDVSVYDYSLNGDPTEERCEREQVLKRMEREKVSMQISFAQAAQYQGNYRLALNKLQQTKNICRSQASHLIDLQVSVTFWLFFLFFLWNTCILTWYVKEEIFV